MQDQKVNLSAEQINTKIQAEMLEKSLQKRAELSNKAFGYVDLRKTPINSDIFGLIEFAYLKKARAVPYFRLGKKLLIAVLDPAHEETQILIKNLIQKQFEIQISITSKASLDFLMDKIEEFQIQKASQDLKTFTSTNIEEFEKEISVIQDIIKKVQPSNIKESLRELMIGAIRVNSSDIHFQPEKLVAKVRFRVDGILQNVGQLDIELYKQLAQQIKFEAGMKINVSDIPQDGRFSFDLNQRQIDLRVSTIPSQFGDNVVIRILDSGKKFASYAELGFADRHIEVLKQVSNLRQGMILITGPTGSGKTTTLYSILTEINDSEKKIITLEDPIEYHLEGIVQSQIQEDKGYTFDKALESVLRQDPDVIMVGEIRNLKVATTAMQASLTGHVVLSTLHTNNAIESIPRLVNMGVEKFMVAPSVEVIMAQRLVRKVCPHCSKMQKMNDEEKAFFEDQLERIKNINKSITTEVGLETPLAVGCNKCNFTGYKGRIILAEIVVMDDEIKNMILNDNNFLDLEKILLNKGFLNLFQDGVIKVLEGKTTLLEIQRVVNDRHNFS